MYNALRANAPMLVTAGQQDTRMLRREPMLAHDLVAMAAPVAKWSTQVQSADEVDTVMRRAFATACEAPCGPVFVSLPVDVMEQQTENLAVAPSRPQRDATPDARGLADACALIKAAHAPVIIASDEVARTGALADLVRLAERIGAPVWHQGLRGHVSFPGSHALARAGLPFDAAGIRKTLAGADLVLLAGGACFEELWFAPGSPFPEGARVLQIQSAPRPLAYNCAVAVDLVADMAPALRAINDAIALATDDAWRAAAQRRSAQLAAQKAQDTAAYRARQEKAWARMPISIPRAVAELHKATPADALIVEEAITASADFAAAFQIDAADAYFGSRGGGIGQALAGAVGTSIGHPGRPVLCVSGDGSAMYSITALWTAAHHALPIVFVILANREYRVLKQNLDIYRQRFDTASDKPYPHMDLAGPGLGFVEMAAGMGVAGVRVSQPDEIAGAIAQAFAEGAPRLVEIEIEGKR